MTLKLEAEQQVVRKSKGRGRTIREWLADRRPDFDPTQHQVVINDINHEETKLDFPLGPLDRIRIIPKA